MHRALLVHEILLNILAALWEADKPYSELNSVARTCRSLSPLALDILWSELSDTRPLLQYLNQNVSDDPRSSILPTSFQRAASRVRKLSCPPLASANDNFSQLTLTERLRRLSLMRTTTPLLPNLLQLSWTDTDEARYVYIQLFLSPTLESFQLDFSFHQPHYFPFLASLSKLCPNLYRVAISKHSVISLMGYDGPSAVQTICRLPHLTTFECESSTISEADLFHLSQLKSLTTLSLGIPSWISSEGLAPRSVMPTKDRADRSWFCNLHKLHLRAYSVSIVTSFIEAGRLPLQTAVFDVSDAPTTASLTECFGTLQSTQRDTLCTAMRQIRICDSLSNATLSVTLLPDSKVITLDVFRPLFAFTKLRSLVLGVCLSFSLSDTDLATMAGSWSELEVFCLNEGRGWRTSSERSITVRGLESLCALCPRLYQIAVVINALDLFPPHPTTSESLHATMQNKPLVQNFAVMHLSLGDSLLAEPRDVAAALSNIFPRLKRISAWQYPLDKLPRGHYYYGLWEEVNRILQLRSRTYNYNRWDC